jgi:hypothetical protein
LSRVSPSFGLLALTQATERLAMLNFLCGMSTS